MTIEDKKNYVRKYIRLGMDKTSAMVLAEFSLEEMDQLEQDEGFTRLCDLEVKLEEKALLTKFETVMNATAAQNDSKDLRWKLSKINPSRWGEGQKAGKTTGTLNITIGGKSPKFDSTAENLEINTSFEEDEEEKRLGGE